MKHLSRPTRSFVYLIILVLLAAYGAFVLLRYYKANIPTYGVESSQDFHTDQPPALEQTWTTYSDPKYPLNFQFPKSWKTKTATTINNFYSISITSPENKIITIYISDSEFFALHGFRTESYILKGAPGFRWQDSIVAVKAGEYYYTFDASQNPKAIPEFEPLLETVQWRS